MRMGLGTAILLLAAPVAFFALFFAGPFLVLAVESLSDRSGAPTAQHYVSVLRIPTIGRRSRTRS